MITQTELPDYIAESIPEIRADLQRASVLKGTNVYSCIQCLAAFTNTMSRQHNYEMLRRCFKLEARLYNRGDGLVKNAVENVCIFSFSTLLSGCQTNRERNLLQSFMPSVLRKIYVKQLLSTGI